MRDIKKMLVQAGQEVFDRESLLRDVLATRLMAWLQRRRFYSHELDELRSIAHDIMGVPIGKLCERLPADVARLNFVDFDSLSAVNLRECVWQAFEYVGVTEKTGIDLLGAARWAALKKRVETLSDSASQAADGEGVAQWSQLALAELVAELFGGKGFSICDVTALADALNSVRDAMGKPRHESRGVTLAALRVLHCRDWGEIDAVVRSGIRGAVWEVCGLCEEVGQAAFGQHWERVRALDVARIEAPASTTPVSASGPARQTVGLRLHGIGDLLAVMGVIVGVIAAGVVGFSAGLAKGRSSEASLRRDSNRGALVQPDAGVRPQVPTIPLAEPVGGWPRQCPGDQPC